MTFMLWIQSLTILRRFNLHVDFIRQVFAANGKRRRYFIAAALVFVVVVIVIVATAVGVTVKTRNNWRISQWIFITWRNPAAEQIALHAGLGSAQLSFVSWSHRPIRLTRGLIRKCVKRIFSQTESAELLQQFHAFWFCYLPTSHLNGLVCSRTTLLRTYQVLWPYDVIIIIKAHHSV